MSNRFLLTRRSVWQRTGWFVAASALVVVSWWSAPRLRAADTLPNEISNDAFWQLIENASEATGAFQSENFLSNETGYQAVIPLLKRTTRSDGVYMGSAPNGTSPTSPRCVEDRLHRRYPPPEHARAHALGAVRDVGRPRRVCLAAVFLKRPAGWARAITVDELFLRL